MKVTVEIPDDIDLAAAVQEAKLSLVMQKSGFRSLTGIEKLGVLVLMALKKSDLLPEEATITKKSLRGKNVAHADGR